MKVDSEFLLRSFFSGTIAPELGLVLFEPKFSGA